MLPLRDRKLLGANCPSSAILHITNCSLEIINDPLITWSISALWSYDLLFTSGCLQGQNDIERHSFFKHIIMSAKGKGKRRGTARDSGGAKRRSGTKEGDNTVAAVSDQPNHSGNASNSKVKDVVDFAAVLKSTDVSCLQHRRASLWPKTKARKMYLLTFFTHYNAGSKC